MILQQIVIKNSAVAFRVVTHPYLCPKMKIQVTIHILIPVTPNLLSVLLYLYYNMIGIFHG